jgi:hypothetical protein
MGHRFFASLDLQFSMTSSKHGPPRFARISGRRTVAAAALVGGISGLAACGESSTNPIVDCTTTTNPVATGSLTMTGTSFSFAASDGWRISFADGAVRIVGPQHPDQIVFWGESDDILIVNHESHSGKHIKDRFGSRRSVLLPDGALMTMVSEGETGPLQTLSIYGGAESHSRYAGPQADA